MLFEGHDINVNACYECNRQFDKVILRVMEIL